MQRTRRHLLGAAITLALFRPESAWAAVPALPVVDLKRGLAMVDLLKDAKTLTDRVSASLTHIKNAAATLGGGNLVDDILISQRYLTGDLHAISYSIDTVTEQFEAVFPSQKAAHDVAPSDVAAVRSAWDAELQESGLAAARAQTALSQIDTNTKSAMDILERSKATTGGTSDEGSQLAKLQALVQMLGIVNSDLTTLATTLAAGERVNAEVQASEASDQDLTYEQSRRVMRDYSSKQPIPEIDPRILRD